jgi:hypothetical protein
MPVTDKECEEYARECVRLANLTTDEIMRERLLQMAREWMAVVMHEKKPSELKVPVQ